MSLNNTPKPGAASLNNVPKSSIGETWASITTTWASETRTWQAVSQLFNNVARANQGTGVALWSVLSFPWLLALPWQAGGSGEGMDNLPKP